jgi:hypothetical protein
MAKPLIDSMIDDRELSIPVYSEVCTLCRHWDIESDKPRHCAAFPDGDGIPMEIWMGGNDHRQPFDGDRGVQFEQREPADDKESRTLRDLARAEGIALPSSERVLETYEDEDGLHLIVAQPDAKDPKPEK